MARYVFFSFDYERDVTRVSQIRKSWVTQGKDSAGFVDSVSWEKVKKGGKEAIERWIRDQMKGTSVVVVLIGSETSESYYVKYEIKHGFEQNKGLLGIYLNNMKNLSGTTDIKGKDPFPILGLYDIRTYDWKNNDGRKNMGTWIEEAYQQSIRR